MPSARTEAFFREFARRPKAELHLHLEGAAAPATLAALSERAGSPLFPDLEAILARRKGLSGSTFLAFYRDVCTLLRAPADYALLARDLCRHLVRGGVSAAEVYVSPAIVERIGLEWPEVASAIEPVFRAHESAGRGSVRVLLDSVRHWGAKAAHRVLDAHERRPWPRVVGFGLGGDEAAVPAREFRDVYRRVRGLGLVPLIHAGEWAGAASVADALDHLEPVRIAHGVRAIEDPGVVAELVRRDVALDVCIASNVATGVVPSVAAHPALRLVDAGVAVTLSTDDPGLFGTTLKSEYRALASLGASPAQLARAARTSLERTTRQPAAARTDSSVKTRS